MKWIIYLILIIFTAKISAQNLYLKFKTENSKNDSIVDKYVANTSFKDIISLNEFLSGFSTKLQNEGYFNSRIGEPEVQNDSVFKVDIKLRQKYKALLINNISEYPEIESKYSPVFNVEDLPAIVEALLNKYSNAGKPFTIVKFNRFGFDSSDTLTADLNITVSKKRTLDNIVLRGYDKFPVAFLKNYASIKGGMVFNRSKLIEQSEKLNTLQFVNQTKTPQVQFTKDSTKLFVYLERAQANSFDGFIGFNNSDENEFQLNGNIDLKLVNNFHAGEEINLNYKNDGNAQEWFNANVRLPYLFKTRFTLGAGLGFFKQDSTFSNTSQHIKLDYQFNSNINMGLSVAFENSSNLLDEELTRDDIQDYDKNRYGLSIVYNRPKRFSNLFLSNQQVSFNVGVGNRSAGDIKQNQRYVEINGRQIFKISKRQFIYTGLNAAFIDSDDYLSNELYRFGGINSIRGFILELNW
jgi:outer membrane protein assembly factor BamA